MSDSKRWWPFSFWSSSKPRERELTPTKYRNPPHEDEESDASYATSREDHSPPKTVPTLPPVLEARVLLRNSVPSELAKCKNTRKSMPPIQIDKVSSSKRNSLPSNDLHNKVIVPDIPQIVPINFEDATQPDAEKVKSSNEGKLESEAEEEEGEPNEEVNADEDKESSEKASLTNVQVTLQVQSEEVVSECLSISQEKDEDVEKAVASLTVAKEDHLYEPVEGELAPVYSTVVKEPPPIPEPDWDEDEDTRSVSSRFTPTAESLAAGWSCEDETDPGKVSKALKRVRKWWRKEIHHPYVPPPLLESTLMLWPPLEGQSGFEDLRKYIKQGGDFCKELASILHERSEAEAQYAKTLGKLSSKLVRATREGLGTVNTAWQRIALEMEAQSELHRTFSTSLSEEVVKPLRQLVESQHRIRKSVETAVDKSGKSLAEWRQAEQKAKKNSFNCARENEKLRDSGAEPRSRLSASSLQLHKPSSDKEIAKLETKRKKAEECVKKADIEYYSVCMRAERARLEWESAVLRGSHCFQVLEEERLKGLKDLGNSFCNHFNHIGPKITEISKRMNEPASACDVIQDMETVTSLKSRTQPSQEQQLPDFYAEHLTLAMNRERRKQALVKLLQLIRQDVERERRGKNGVENLARALKQTPNFATEDTQHNVSEKLHHMRSMLAYLEATRYKVQAALAEVEGRPKESHPLAEHIHISRDRQGLQHSTLKVPSWVHKEGVEGSDCTDWVERGTADGNSVQPDSDFDEFSSQGSEQDFETSVIRVSENSVPLKCKALYNYKANLYDELSLNPGDIINIHDKQPDGWWLGELNGVVGIFPATYVEEIK